MIEHSLIFLLANENSLLHFPYNMQKKPKVPK